MLNTGIEPGSNSQTSECIFSIDDTDVEPHTVLRCNADPDLDQHQPLYGSRE